MSISGTKKDRLRERLRKSNTVKNLAKKRIAEIANNLSARINRLERQITLADKLAEAVIFNHDEVVVHNLARDYLGERGEK